MLRLAQNLGIYAVSLNWICGTMPQSSPPRRVPRRGRPNKPEKRLMNADAIRTRRGKRDMSLLLGAIADDFTGATDLANTLVRSGMRTVQVIGVPQPGTEVPQADAVVVALKTRTCPVAEAVAESLGALAWLKQEGARQIFFKYCSTFDSTDKGNIGSVA